MITFTVNNQTEWDNLQTNINDASDSTIEINLNSAPAPLSPLTINIPGNVVSFAILGSSTSITFDLSFTTSPNIGTSPLLLNIENLLIKGYFDIARDNLDNTLSFLGINDIDASALNSAGIHVTDSNKLIVTSTLSTSSLTILAGLSCAGIGGNTGEDCGEIVISGKANIVSTGGECDIFSGSGAGIGGGGSDTGGGSGGNITINNYANLTAFGGKLISSLGATGAGIGGGGGYNNSGGYGGVITISENAVVNVTSGASGDNSAVGAGIGGGGSYFGTGGDGGIINISTSVTVTSSSSSAGNDSNTGAGIGGGGGDIGGNSGTITISSISSSAAIIATSGSALDDSGVGAGIGGGAGYTSGNGYKINISGAVSVTATAGTSSALAFTISTAAGIGGSGAIGIDPPNFEPGGNCGTIIISGNGLITATAGSVDANDIGNGAHNSSTSCERLLVGPNINIKRPTLGILEFKLSTGGNYIGPLYLLSQSDPSLELQTNTDDSGFLKIYGDISSSYYFRTSLPTGPSSNNFTLPLETSPLILLIGKLSRGINLFKIDF